MSTPMPSLCRWELSALIDVSDAAHSNPAEIASAYARSRDAAASASPAKPTVPTKIASVAGS